MDASKIDIEYLNSVVIPDLILDGNKKVKISRFRSAIPKSWSDKQISRPALDQILKNSDLVIDWNKEEIILFPETYFSEYTPPVTYSTKIAELKKEGIKYIYIDDLKDELPDLKLSNRAFKKDLISKGYKVGIRGSKCKNAVFI